MVVLAGAGNQGAWRSKVTLVAGQWQGSPGNCRASGEREASFAFNENELASLASSTRPAGRPSGWLAGGGEQVLEIVELAGSRRRRVAISSKWPELNVTNQMLFGF